MVIAPLWGFLAVARNDGKLTEKQQRFCLEFLKDFNATQAYKRAGYSAKTDGAVRTQSCKLMTNPNIQAEIARLRFERSTASNVTIERTLQELARVAFSDITNSLSFSSDGVVLKDSKDLPEDVTAAINSVSSSVTNNEGAITTSFNLKQHDKLRALTLLADYFGIRDDFNKARATLKRYGLAVVEDDDSDLGWALEAYTPSNEPDAV